MYEPTPHVHPGNYRVNEHHSGPVLPKIYLRTWPVRPQKYAEYPYPAKEAEE